MRSGGSRRCHRVRATGKNRERPAPVARPRGGVGGARGSANPDRQALDGCAGASNGPRQALADHPAQFARHIQQAGRPAAMAGPDHRLQDRRRRCFSLGRRWRCVVASRRRRLRIARRRLALRGQPDAASVPLEPMPRPEPPVAVLITAAQPCRNFWIWKEPADCLDVDCGLQLAAILDLLGRQPASTARRQDSAARPRPQRHGEGRVGCTCSQIEAAWRPGGALEA